MTSLTSSVSQRRQPSQGGRSPAESYTPPSTSPQTLWLRSTACARVSVAFAEKSMDTRMLVSVIGVSPSIMRPHGKGLLRLFLARAVPGVPRGWERTMWMWVLVSLCGWTGGDSAACEYDSCRNANNSRVGVAEFSVSAGPGRPSYVRPRRILCFLAWGLLEKTLPACKENGPGKRPGAHTERKLMKVEDSMRTL